ncbi:hypothetical protein [Streptomyces sp. NRRL B-1347]|uniref:hypothetical protein n=1 Tax=Streptomyces sp. NRRL B-1347 TaxID=1476877 RepID=UPI0004C80178|nr:hypothetical protein [Streptomyces sp. NRRL B-1347]
MPAYAIYGICARRVEDGQPGELLACASTDDFAELQDHLAEFASVYADRDDVMLDIDTTLPAP